MSLYMHNKHAQYTHIYINKDLYFGCDSSFDSTMNFFVIIIVLKSTAYN